MKLKSISLSKDGCIFNDGDEVLFKDWGSKKAAQFQKYELEKEKEAGVENLVAFLENMDKQVKKRVEEAKKKPVKELTPIK